MVGETVSRCPLSIALASWMALFSIIHRFKSTAKLELRVHSRVWFGLTNAKCLSTQSTDTLGVPPCPLPGPLDQPTVSLDLDLTANDPRMRPNHALSLILVAVIQVRRNCRQFRLDRRKIA